jgi:lambda repressor-like predicted transcriptional regulator
MASLAAFGLACNVFQVIDFALTTITLCKQVYDRGTLDKVQQLQDEVVIFKTSDKQLRYDRNQMPQSQTEEDKTLRTVATACIRISTDLEAELERFQSKASHSIASSIKVTIKLIWPNKLDKLKKQLAEQRRILQDSS